MEITLQTFLLLLFLSIIFIIFTYIKYFKRKKNVPPSPQKLPIIGNLHQLGTSPHHSLETLSRKHGPIMLLHLGSVPTLVASSLEAAQEILQTHDSSFASRPSSTILKILLYGCKDLAFSPKGEYWRQLKSIVVSHLLSNSQLKSYKNLREKEVGLMVDMVGESCGCGVDMSALFVSLSEKIMCKVAIGGTYEGVKLINLLRRYLKMFTAFSVGSFIPWLSWVDRLSGLLGRAEKVTKEFDMFLENVLEEHETKKRHDDDRNDDDGDEDFVDILLKVQKDEKSGFTFNRDTIKAVILDIFGGGIDNTSTNLEWVMSELVRNPRVMKTLQKEVTDIAQGRSVITEEDVEKMQYLKAIVKESLRLHPPVPLLLPRESINDVKLMGYDIPSGTQVLINVWKIGRDSTYWDEPNEFWPERFLTNSFKYKGNHFEWLPFGAGRRRCPGLLFSINIIELAIANIVYKFDLGLPTGVKHEDLDMSEMYGITVHRKLPLLVNASPRF